MKLRIFLSIVCLSTVSIFGRGANYVNSGGGFQLGFVVVDDDWHGWHDNDDIDLGINFGGHGHINFDIGKFGKIQYRPGLDVWFGWENDGYYDRSITEIALNLFDGRYYFPIPENIAARPFAGFGPAIMIDVYHEERPELEDETETKADPAMNIYCGVDLRLSPSAIFFLETRGKFGDWDVFKLMCGFSFFSR